MSTQRKAVGLRRSVLDSKSRNKRGKGGWRGSYKDRLDIPKAEETDILLTRAEYENPEDKDEKTGELGAAHFHTCMMHGVKLRPQGKDSYYSARCNIDAGQEDCLACKRKAEGDRRITEKPTFSFNALHLALHEKVPLVREGKVVKYEEGDKRGQPILTWELVEKPRRRQEILDDADRLVEKGEVALFRKKYIEVGAGHRDELSAIDERASHFCKCGGELKPVRFICEQCEEILADVHDDDMAPKEVLSFASSREKCKSCGHIGLPSPENVCNTCDDPAPLSAFDVVASVRKEGEGAGTHIVIMKITPLDRYQLPNGASLIEWEKKTPKKGAPYYDPKFDDNDDFIFTEDFDVKKAVEGQFDFEVVHEPRDHSFHANKLGCENPFGSSGGGSKYKQYGGAGGKSNESRTRVDDDKDDDEPTRGRGRGGRDTTEESSRGRRDEPEEPRGRRRVSSAR